LEDVNRSVVKLVQNFFSEKFFKIDGEYFICRKDIELNLFIAFILLGQDKMAHVFLRIVKARFVFKLSLYASFLFLFEQLFINSGDI